MPNWWTNYLWIEGERGSVDEAARMIAAGVSQFKRDDAYLGGVMGRDEGSRFSFETRWSPGTDQVSELAGIFTNLTITHVFYELNSAYQGFGVYQFGGCTRYGREGIDLDSCRGFCDHFPKIGELRELSAGGTAERSGGGATARPSLRPSAALLVSIVFECEAGGFELEGKSYSSVPSSIEIAGTVYQLDETEDADHAVWAHYLQERDATALRATRAASGARTPE